MKILAINGSPRAKKSCTEQMLMPLLEGMRQAGAETEVVYLADKKIHHCIGCFACWFKTPGVCIFKDDMVKLLEKMITADFLVYGTPLYVYAPTGLMKNFLDRSLPLALPFMEEGDGAEHVTTHSVRYGKDDVKTLLVSPCGFPEFEHFSPLVDTFKKLASNNYVGEILRPAAQLMQNEAFQQQAQTYFSALRKAGEQLITDGKISAEITTELNKLWLSPEECRRRANEAIQEMLLAVQAKKSDIKV